VLNITNGGLVTVSGTTSINSASSLSFGAGGGTLTTQAFNASPAQVTGTGTILTCGALLDGNLVFDSSHGTTQILNWTGIGQNVTVRLQVSGAGGTTGDLAVGSQGAGTLTVQNGVAIKTLSVQNTTLDDVFVHYTGRQLRDEQVKPSAYVMPPRPGLQP